MKKLSNISISTIEIFCQLYLKGSTKAVSSDLSLSQPKVSRGLNSLREVFDDPLFVRINNQLVATELAHSLHVLLAEILLCSRAIESDAIKSVSPVEPAIIIGTVPQLEIGLAQKIIKRAADNNQNPNIAVSTTAWSELSEQQLIDGEIDAAICFRPSTRKELLSKSIIQHRGGYLVAQSQHPVWDNPTIDNMTDFPIVKLVTMPFPANRSPLGIYAKAQGKPMQVYATAPDLGSAASSLLNSHAVMVVGVKCAVDFLASINGLHAQKIDYSQDKCLLKGFSDPTVYLWLRRDADGKIVSPLWLQQALETYIITSHK
ncbi:LysR family transcriptional regulator [Shewanella abyssi]|uniref:LysR family transcriptional regulator n=1 Tax=Shewanella abyssi TaxID=311789 RepID=UPI00200D0093|nr:LysR family transcriptional regulator [Shewanella abyssi]MCL1048716.1 LysR family transcriptional regulator [Shewanella abyssi]